MLNFPEGQGQISKIFLNLKNVQNKRTVSEAKLLSNFIANHQGSLAGPEALPEPAYMSSTTFSYDTLDKNQTTIILVLSARDNISQRKAILKTWAKNHKSNVFFFVGQPCSIPPEYSKRYECQLDARNIEGFPTAQQNESWINHQNIKSELLLKEDNVVYLDEVIDSYRTLPLKLKYAYKWALEKFPKAKYFVKADDDMYLRVEKLQQYLTENYDYISVNSTNPLIIGRVRQLNVGKRKESPNYEPNYNHFKYPPFPIGSYGYVVNRHWAKYVVDNLETLFNYQGEDTSTGIWMDESPLGFRETIRYVNSFYFENDRDCYRNDRLIVGHRLNNKKMALCYEADRRRSGGNSTEDAPAFAVEKVNALSSLSNKT